MSAGEQFVTIGAVLLGALTTHVTNYSLERNRNRYQLLPRWDDKKLDAYEGYVDRVRACVYLAVQLRAPGGRPAERGFGVAVAW